jgi:predicted DsbA family dithiol-disulfide isomerase
MATIIDLQAARARRARRSAPVFAYDLADPAAYAAASDAATVAEWRPAIAEGQEQGRIAARVALRAHERGVGREFALAHLRLVHRWEQPVDALETLAQAAGVAGLKLDDVLDAAYDPRRDDDLTADAAQPLRRAR